MPGAILYSGTDQRSLPITLTLDQFMNHIAPRHHDFDQCWPFPESRSQACLLTCSNFLCLDDALRNPYVILRDKGYDDRDNYYGPPVVNSAALGLQYQFLKVCVEFRNGKGRVITAFGEDEVHRYDRPLVAR